jgi:hypothetical protein
MMEDRISVPEIEGRINDLPEQDLITINPAHPEILQLESLELMVLQMRPNPETAPQRQKPKIKTTISSINWTRQEAAIKAAVLKTNPLKRKPKICKA